MLNPPNLGNNDFNVCQKPFRIVVVQDIHVNPLIAAGQECFVVVLSFNAAPNRCQYESPWIDGF